MLQYFALYEREEDGGFVVTFPDFAWGVTEGDTEEEAVEMAADALACIISEQIRNGEDLPEPKPRRGHRYRPVHLPATQAAKAELYRQFMAAGIRKSELARRMGISKGNIERLFDLNHNSRLDQIEAGFHALGKTLAIEVRDAA